MASSDDLRTWIDTVLLPRLTPEILFPEIDLREFGKELRSACPLHGGTNPTSFSVDPERWIYYCFSCQERGNAFTWLDRSRGMGFRDALEWLAGQCGLEVPGSGAGGRGCDPQVRLLRAFREVCRTEARSEAGRLALGELEDERGLSSGALDRSGLGWYSDVGRMWKALQGAYPELVQPAKEAGLLQRLWNNRVVGVWEGLGKPAGTIWGRALDPGREPKYVYAKGLTQKGLPPWGWERARRRTGKKQPVIVVEGFLDAVHLWDIGLAQAVALGGAGRRADADWWRFVEETLGWGQVILALDNDEAGLRGTRDALQQALDAKVQVETHVLDPTSLGTAKDLDEWLREGRGEAEASRLLASDSVVSALEYELSVELAGWGNSPRSDLAIVDRCLALLCRYRETTRAYFLARGAAQLGAGTGWSPELLLETMAEVARREGVEPLPASILVPEKAKSFRPAEVGPEAVDPTYVQRARVRFPRAYLSWTPEEEADLLEALERGEKVSSIAKKHQRQVSAIRSRMRKLLGGEPEPGGGEERRRQEYVDKRLFLVARRIRADYPGHLVFVQCGVFYNVFEEDVPPVSTVLGWQSFRHGSAQSAGGLRAGKRKWLSEIEDAGLPYVLADTPGEEVTPRKRGRWRRIVKVWPDAPPPS